MQTGNATNPALAERVRAGLADVIDPEIGRGVVEIGLIYAVDADRQGNVHIAMTTTTPGCPASGILLEGVRYAVLAVEGVHSVDVELTYEPPWRPDMMAS